MRRIFVTVAVMGTIVLTPSEAQACSCVPPDAGRLLAASDGAFIGTFLDRDEPVPRIGSVEGQPVPVRGPGTVAYRFRVERVLKGAIGREITVLSSADGASCGLGVEPGQQTALTLDKRGARWHSSLCQQLFDAGALETAAGGGRPPPGVDSAGWSAPAVIVLLTLVASVAAIGATHARRGG